MTDKVILSCFMCFKEFQLGPNTYEGRHIAAYNVTVCSICYQVNWDGWAPAYEPRLINHLSSEGISVPARNAKGRLPRDG